MLRARLFATFIASIAMTVASTSVAACPDPLSLLCTGARIVAAPADSNYAIFTSSYATFGPVHTLERSKKTPNLIVTDANGVDQNASVTPLSGVDGAWYVSFATPLIAGARYHAKWQRVCEADAGSSLEVDEADMTVPPAAPLAEKLGVVVASAPVRHSFAKTSCDAIEAHAEDVTVRVELVADSSYVPWEDVAHVELLVDDVVLDNIPWQRRAFDESGALRASCDPLVSTGISPTKHIVTFRSVVPGLTESLTASTTVDFSCPAGGALSASEKGANATTSSGGASAPASATDASAEQSSCAFATNTSANTMSTVVLVVAASSIAFVRRRFASRRTRAYE